MSSDNVEMPSTTLLGGNQNDVTDQEDEGLMSVDQIVGRNDHSIIARMKVEQNNSDDVRSFEIIHRKSDNQI